MNYNGPPATEKIVNLSVGQWEGTWSDRSCQDSLLDMPGVLRSDKVLKVIKKKPLWSPTVSKSKNKFLVLHNI